MKNCKTRFCSLFRFLVIIIISLFLATIFTTLLHTSNSLELIEDFLKKKTNETTGKIISLLAIGFILSMIFFSMMYAFIRLFHNQNKLLSNDIVTHEYLLQFEEVRRIAILKLEEQLEHLYLQESKNKHRKVSNKLVQSQIHKLEGEVENLRNYSRDRSGSNTNNHLI